MLSFIDFFLMVYIGYLFFSNRALYLEYEDSKKKIKKIFRKYHQKTY
jgi:hypothetical protein